jgi:transposase-like protein
MTCDLTDPIFTDEAAAWAHFEAIRWPDGPVCYHCGTLGMSGKSKGKTTRRGLYNCRACREPFTATMGTVYERSHIPMHKWLLASHLMASSKKGISAHQLYRMLGFGSYRTAWFMAHRIREAMKPELHREPMGGGGTPVEVDETFIGHDIATPPMPEAPMRVSNMNKVLSLIDRETGEARSFVVKDLRMATIVPIIEKNVAREAWLMSDEATRYTTLGWNFSAHGSVNHGAGEYVSKADPRIHTNTVEGFYSIFKRGMKGVYQHCASRHLHRYVVEFDFRYSNRIAVGVDDKERAERAVKGAVGKRLTYRRPYGRRSTGLHPAQAVW